MRAAARLPVQQIKADAIGKLVSVCGTVVRATAPTPVVTEMEFVCGKCGEATRAAFPDGRYTPPEGCPTQGCRSRVLTPQQQSSTCMDWQRISLQVVHAAGPGFWVALLVPPRPACSAVLTAAVLLLSQSPARPCVHVSPPAVPARLPTQGLPKDEKAAMGRVPVPIAVELTEDLVGCCAPGDVATVVGVVKVMNGDLGPGGASWGGTKGSQQRPAQACPRTQWSASLRRGLRRGLPSALCVTLESCARPAHPAGKKAGTLKAQCLFLPYIDALSVVVAGKEAARPHLRLQEAVSGGEEAGSGGGARDGELDFLPPNMPSFSQLDLDFVCKFTEVGLHGWRACGAWSSLRPHF